MVRIYFASVANLIVSEAIRIGAPSPEEIVPEKQVRAQLAVVPGIASDIVSPSVPIVIISVYDVAMVPVTIPIFVNIFCSRREDASPETYQRRCST